MSKLSKGLLAATVAALVLPVGAYAEETPTTMTLSPSVTVEPGGLGWTTAPTAGNFASVKLDGSDQTTYGTLHSWGVDDERGTDAGWNVTASATPLTDAGTATTLAHGLLTMTAPESVASESGLGAEYAPAIEDTSTALDNAGETPVQVARAESGKGMAKWGFDQADTPHGDLAVTIPANTLAGEYTTTITFTIGNTP